MKLSPLAKDLYAELAETTVIDAHQHLPAEADYLAFQYAGLNLFAGGYIWHDLESAGLSPEFKATMREGGPRPVETWWPVIRPYWEQVKQTSYARALRIAANGLYGLPDINDETIGELAARVIADNTPGLYHRVLQEACRIQYSITCVDQAAFPNDPGLRGLTQLTKFGRWSDPVRSLEEQTGGSIGSLEEAAAAAQEPLRQALAAGAVGFKISVAHYGAPDAAAAQAEFAQSERTGANCIALIDYLFDKCLDVAAEADVPVAVHTGYWGDFRELNPMLMFPFAVRRRDVRFDLFHLGVPYVREAALMGKNLPNVTLNLTWCPVISQTMTVQALNELVDLVPVTKVIAFGGDYRAAVQKTYGHLVMAKEVVAAALADRIEAGDFDREYAVHLARLWLHDNAARVYRLPR